MNKLYEMLSEVSNILNKAVLVNDMLQLTMLLQKENQLANLDQRLPLLIVSTVLEDEPDDFIHKNFDLSDLQNRTIAIFDQLNNRYNTGGIVNLKLKEWKALKNVDYVAVPDTSFTKDKTGVGDIEVIPKRRLGVTYPNGYYKASPRPNKNVILYNPKNNDQQDVRLDALHLMPQDPTYDTLNLLYREAAKGGDPAHSAKMRYKDDVEKYGRDNVDSEELYFNNEADALLRNVFIEGTPQYIKSRNYRTDIDNLIKENDYLMPYINNIRLYLETGQRPTQIQTRDNYSGDILNSNLLDEVTVVGKKEMDN